MTHGLLAGDLVAVNTGPILVPATAVGVTSTPTAIRKVTAMTAETPTITTPPEPVTPAVNMLALLDQVTNAAAATWHPGQWDYYGDNALADALTACKGAGCSGLAMIYAVREGNRRARVAWEAAHPANVVDGPDSWWTPACRTES